MSETLKLLIIEDNPADARLIREFLSDVPGTTCSITEAGTIQQALEALAKGPVDAVLLDLSLPDCRGLRSLELVKGAAPHTPIIVLTGLGDDAIAILAVQDGAQDYLVKGEFEGRTLVRAVRYAVERVRSEEAERERRGLEAALTAMDRLLAVIGHELRTPLASLQLLSEYMLSDQDSAASQWEENLTSINHEVLRMSDMVNNLLEAARLDSGVSQWHWGTVDLCALGEEVQTLLRPLTDPTRVHVSVSGIQPGLQFRGDASAVRRLLVNLGSNAAKYTKDGEIAIEATRRVIGNSDWVHIRVHDTGPGIPEDVLRRLGEAFAINSGFSRSATGGTGLGLAICKGIASAHGGRISVASEVGKGTTFTVALQGDLSGPAPMPAESKILREAAA